MSELKAIRVAYGEALAELGEKNQKVVVLDADLAHATMTATFADKFPERFFNAGIAAVSYTHLDVYKRQGVTWPIIRFKTMTTPKCTRSMFKSLTMGRRTGSIRVRIAPGSINMPRISSTTLMMNRITAGFWLIPRINLAISAEAPSFTSTYVNSVEVPMMNSCLLYTSTGCWPR